MSNPSNASAGGQPNLLGVNQLQTEIDQLKKTVHDLNAGLSQVLPQLHHTSRVMAGGGFANTFGSMLLGHGGGGNRNGGGAVFGGVPQGPAPRGPGGPGGAPLPGGGQGGGGRGNGGGATFGDYGPTLAIAAYDTIKAGMARWRAKVPDAMNYDLVSSMLSRYGYGSYGDVRRSLRGNVTAMNAADVVATRWDLTNGLNIRPGSAQDKQMQGAIGAVSFSNPMISNQETAQANVAINQPFMIAKYRGLGLNAPSGYKQKLDTMTLARQILSAIPSSNTIKTSEQIDFDLNDPNGSISLTLDNWEAHGYLPPGSKPVVKESIRTILMARMKGVGFDQLTKLEADAQKGGLAGRSAKAQLRKLKVADTSAVERKKESAAAVRDELVDTMTDLVDAFKPLIDAGSDLTKAITPVIKGFTTLAAPLVKLAGLGIKMTTGPLGLLGDIASKLLPSSPGAGAGGADQMMSGGFGGQQDQTQNTTTAGTTRDASQPTGTNAPTGSPGTKSGSGKASGSGATKLKFIKPINGPITSPFGMRNDPKTGQRKKHTGIDFGASVGTPIHAAAAGRVTFSGSGGGRSWAGNYVMIDHGGNVQTLYAHQSRPSARVGSTVSQGQVIGYSGQTGRATGPHLHFEIHISGTAVDPAPYLAGASVAVDSTLSDQTTQGAQGAGQGTQGTGTPAAASPGQAGIQAPAASISGISPSEREVLASFFASGLTGATAPSSNTASGSSSGTSATSTSDTAGTSTPSAPTSVSGNVALGKQKAAAFGWTGKEWDALYQLWQHESGWKMNADNPTSSAYGIPQALEKLHFKDPKARAAYHNSAAVQIDWGLNYVKQSYRTPSNAWAKWQARSPHWYDTGAWEMPRDEQIFAHKGEMILPAKEARQIREVLLNGTPYGANKAGSTGGLSITIEQGAIVVQSNGSVTSAGVQDLGRSVANALAEHEKIKRLQAGVLR